MGKRKDAVCVAAMNGQEESDREFIHCVRGDRKLRLFGGQVELSSETPGDVWPSCLLSFQELTAWVGEHLSPRPQGPSLSSCVREELVVTCSHAGTVTDSEQALADSAWADDAAGNAVVTPLSVSSILTSHRSQISKEITGPTHSQYIVSGRCRQAQCSHRLQVLTTCKAPVLSLPE